MFAAATEPVPLLMMQPSSTSPPDRHYPASLKHMVTPVVHIHSEVGSGTVTLPETVIAVEGPTATSGSHWEKLHLEY